MFTSLTTESESIRIGLMKSCDVPHIGDKIRVFISKDAGGGYYVASVTNVSSPAENEYFALVSIQRKYQNGRISPNDLKKKTMTIPLNVSELWEHVKSGS